MFAGNPRHDKLQTIMNGIELHLARHQRLKVQRGNVIGVI